MDAPAKLIVGAALVCLASAAFAARGQASPVEPSPVTAATKQNQTAPFRWSTFGLLPAGPAQLNAQFVPMNVAPITKTGSSGERFRRESASNSTTKKKKKSKSKRTQTQIAECLAAHNKMRKLHNVPELQWDDKLAAFAQKRSNHIASTDGKEFGHPPDLPFGENLFWHSSLEKGCEYMVKGWYDEIGLYDFKAPTFAPATGHFTQMIWRGTQRVGCAFAPSTGPRGGLYLTCNYDPPGNWVGEFEENVPLPKGLPTTVASRPTTTLAPTTPTTTARPVTTLATTAAPTSQAPTTTTTTTTANPKSKSKKKKKSGKRKGDKDKKKGNKKRNKKKKPPTTTTASPASVTTPQPGLISQ